MNNPSAITIFTDGGSRGNPGISGAGIYVIDQDGQFVFDKNVPLGENKTNNEAEYLAFFHSAQWLQGQKNEFTELKKVTWKLDSKLVVEQLNKRWKIKQPHLAKLAGECQEILVTLPYSVEIMYVPREQNKEADALANQAMDSYCL